MYICVSIKHVWENDHNILASRGCSDWWETKWLFMSSYLNVFFELFTTSIYYLCQQPYLQCEKEKNELSFGKQVFSCFILAIEYQHIILMKEVSFVILPLLYLDSIFQWSWFDLCIADDLMNAHWRNKMVVWSRAEKRAYLLWK